MNSTVSLQKGLEKYFLGENAWLHPLRITIGSGYLGVIALTCLLNENTENLAAPLLAVSYAGDFLDGKFAKWFDNKTVEGATLDPAHDKLRDITSTITFYGILGPTNPLVMAKIGGGLIDVINQSMTRGNILKHISLDSIKYLLDPSKATHIKSDENSGDEAVNWGKWKTVTQSIVNVGTVSAITYSDNFDNTIMYSMTALTGASIGFCLKGVYDRTVKPKKELITN